MKQKSGSLKRQTILTNPWQMWLEWGCKRPKLIKVEMKQG
jgi:hypothetical protein